MKTYFTPKECCVIPDMSWDQINAFEDLVIHTLTPLREAYGKPIKINSGFRTIEHNKEIGGAPNSQHMALGNGAACDIDTGSITENLKLVEIVKSKKIPYDQMIVEKSGEWIHISLRTDIKNRFQVLSIP